MPTKYVVNSSDTNPVYFFFIPIISVLWKKYIGYEPVTILIGSKDEYMKRHDTGFAYEWADRFSKIIHVQPAPGYRTSSSSQLSRLLLAADPFFKDDDYILTSDADMLPLNRAYFNQQNWGKLFHIFSADAYTDITKGWEPLKFPICYLGANSSVWKEIMGIKTNDIYQELTSALHGRADVWDNDEQYFDAKFKSHRYYEGPISNKTYAHMMVRTWPGSRANLRIDRENWYFNGEKNFIDCHCPRPGFDHNNQILEILKTYSPTEYNWFADYMGTFKRQHDLK